MTDTLVFDPIKDMTGTDRVLEVLRKFGITQFAERNITIPRTSGTHSVSVPLDIPLEQIIVAALSKELGNIHVTLEKR